MKMFASEKLGCMLNFQKPHSDKGGLGFKFVPSTSHTPLDTKGEIAFVSASSDKG
jgi:hypothetical protein